MADVEIVLRFFAFREPEKLSGSVRSMLDGTMKRLRHPDAEALQTLQQHFMEALNLCVAIFGLDTFRLQPIGGKPGKISRPLYDAEMVAVFNLRQHRDALLDKRQAIRESLLGLTDPDAETYDLMVGRGNTANTIRDRINKVEEVIKGIIND